MHNLNLSFTVLNPKFLGHQGMSGERAQELIESGFVKHVCDSADVIVIADTIPDGRPIFQSLLHSNPAYRCKSNIILEHTNRFDWYIEDYQEYFRLYWTLVHRNFSNLFFVANNPFEARDVADQTLATPLFRLLRPLGVSTIEAKPIPTNDRQKIIIRLDKDTKLYEILQNLNLQSHLKIVPGGSDAKYGGPQTLAQYRAYIEFPYQISTMKLYENLRAGVVTLLPTPEFFEFLVRNNYHYFGGYENRLGPFDKLLIARNSTRSVGIPWNLMDYYHDDICQYMYYFNSFEQLREMILSENIDPRNVKASGPIAYGRIAEKSLHGWQGLLAKMGYHVGGEIAVGNDDFEYMEKIGAPVNIPETEDEWREEIEWLQDWIEEIIFE